MQDALAASCSIQIPMPAASDADRSDLSETGKMDGCRIYTGLCAVYGSHLVWK